MQADAFHLPYPDKLFHACVTSPPYWGLRKYAGDQGEEPLGLETTPERHIERMVEVFREVRRVLRDDGVVWLNYGDCYAGSGGAHTAAHSNPGISRSAERGGIAAQVLAEGGRTVSRLPIPAGNIMLMPHRLAIALQSDGWIVRNDLVWFKRNPMPESVAGWRFENGKLRKSSWRHTRAHEYIFQLVKGMGYYCNQEAVREPVITRPDDASGMAFGSKDGKLNTSEKAHAADLGHKWEWAPGRNPRSVLDVPTAPYKGSHYATFPPKLIAPLIRASVPRRCCPECGMAWAPVVEKATGGAIGEAWLDHSHDEERGGFKTVSSEGYKRGETKGYRPTCDCGIEEHEPGIVLDIFGGSGTTGMVAKQLLRRWVVMDISRPYLDEQSKIRTKTGTPSNALEGLPMFGGKPEEKTKKQDEVGKRTYTGFNERWDEKHP